jgi:hypothetical protein
MSVLRTLRRPSRSAGWPFVSGREAADSTLHRPLVVVAGLAVVVAVSVGCGGSSSNKEAVSADAGTNDVASSSSAEGDAFSTDAGTFECGDAFCSPSEICLTPAYGCLGLLPDAGVCPDGWAYWDASGVCLPPPPPPSCVSPAPGMGSFDCSEGDAGAACGTVNAPVPSGCSRMCRGICV